ncbi:MAG: family 16 glycosylhydrolase [Verrucomicrobia bacterium]|nr:family 16 glycosylhydrolase [Verrucomicrobiota bacterium]
MAPAWIAANGSIGPAAQLSFQKSENVSAANGLLRIALKKEDVGNLHYSAGGVISKREFLYAYFAARFRCPKTAGWHTSFWTVNRGTIDPSTSKPWAHRQEIDICEQDSANNHYYSAGVIDWSRTPPQGARNLGRQYFRNNTADFSAGFHIWSCEFTPEVVRFFFDGKLTHEVDAKQFPQGPHSVRLTSLALPYWPDSVKPIGVDDSHLPVYADFDWVRVYQK